MKFILATINGTATTTLYLSFIAFLVFVVKGIELYKIAFWVMVVSLVIGFLTPNKGELKEFFNGKSTTNKQ